MAERWTKKLSFPKMGRSRETESVAHQAIGPVGGQPIGAGLEVGLAADHSQTRRDPGADAAEILSSCELIPSAMPLPSIQESGPSTADETSEGNRNHIVEAADRLSQDRAFTVKHSGNMQSHPAEGRSHPEIGPASVRDEVDELRAVNYKLREDIKAMSEQVSIYERRLATGKGAYKEECMKLREEVALLQEENSALQYEIDNLNKVASYVGSRVAKVLVGARRANNYNSSLVAELKRWNRKLEVENQRLYAIIDRLQNRDAGSDTASMASEMSYHPRDDSALLVKRLEEQNRNLQREISALSADAANLQHLSAGAGERLPPRAVVAARPPAPASDCDNSTSSGSADGPKTPSLHEEDGPANSKAEEREKLEAARAETEALRLQLDNKIEELKRENVRLIEELARVNDELAVVQSQVSEMEELKGQYEQSCKEVLVLKESVVKLRREAVVAREFRDENMRLEDELSRIQKQSAEYEEELAELEAEVDRLQALVTDHPAVTGQMTSLEEQVSHLQATNELLQESLQQLRSQHHALLEKSAAADARKGDRSVAQFRQLKAPSGLHLGEQLKDLREENARLAERAMRADALQQQLAEAEKQIAGFRSAAGENAAVEAVHSRRVEQLRAEEEELKKQLTALQESLAAESATASAYAALKKETKSNRKQLDKLLAENRMLGQKKTELELALAEIKTSEDAQLGSVKSQLTAALDNIANLQQENSRAVSELSVAQKELAALQAVQGSRSSDAQAEIERLKAEFATERERLEANLREQKSAASEVSELRSQLEALRAEAATTSLRADTLLAQKESLEARLNANAETVALASDSATLVQNARTEVESLRAQNQTYQEELQALRQRVQELKKKEVQTPMFGIKGRSESSTVMGLRKENAALRAQADGLTELKAENERLRAQIATRPDGAGSAAVLQKDMDALRIANRSLEGRIQELQVEASEMEALRGGVLKGRTPQDVVAEVRALFAENGELRREAQKAKSLATEVQSLQQKLSLHNLQMGPQSTVQHVTPKASPARSTSMDPATPELVSAAGRPGRSAATVASHSLKLAESDTVNSSDTAEARQGPAADAEEWASADEEVEHGGGVTAAAPSPQQASSAKPANPGQQQTRGFWSKQPRVFGTFMKRSALDKAPAPVVAHQAASLASELEELDAISVELAEQQVNNAYNQFGQDHNVSGFMQALGFDGFTDASLRKGPLSGLFAAAIKATSPHADKKYESPWDKELAAAAHRRLVCWSKSTGI
eukprot:jgi/Botrbrau1/9987/Bobra.0012s0076.2